MFAAALALTVVAVGEVPAVRLVTHALRDVGEVAGYVVIVVLLGVGVIVVLASVVAIVVVVVMVGFVVAVVVVVVQVIVDFVMVNEVLVFAVGSNVDIDFVVFASMLACSTVLLVFPMMV